MSLRRILAAVLLLGALLIPAAAADQGAPDHYLLGGIPAHGPHVPPAPAQGPPGPGGLPAQAAARAGGSSGALNLTYHGGPVLHTNKTYAIYWAPAGAVFDANYQSEINTFFSNVASASGTTSNVYASDVQYSDTSGAIQYKSTFGGAFQYTGAIPNNTYCVQQYTNAGMTAAGGCVLDSDIENVVSSVASANGLPADGNTIYFVFTPKDVGSCWSTSGGTCAYNYYCAYHSNFSRSGGNYLYANMPYSDSSGVIGYQDCSVSNGSPNNDWADPTLSVTSHEHNETITDPYGNAWYDAQGNENGDKCAWNYGTAIGNTGTGDYNQVINGGRYYLQQEWSNATGSCVLSYGPAAPPPAPVVSSFTPSGGGPVGTAVTLTGQYFTGATSVTFNGTPATFKVASDTSITTTVPTSATTGPIAVTTPSGTGQSQSFTVQPSPPSSFSISVSPSTQTVRRGSSASYTVTIARTNFTGSVSLTVAGVPAGASASFRPSTTSGTSSTLTITTRRNTQTTGGSGATLTITGTSGAVQATTSANLVVN